MDNFPDPLDMQLLPGGYTWSLLKVFAVKDDILGLVIAPMGFVTDLGSIPKLFWNIIPPNGKPTDAYVIHDYLYAKQNFTRAQSDACLLRMMESLTVSWIERWTIYVAVRFGGWHAWASDAKKKEIKVI